MCDEDPGGPEAPNEELPEPNKNIVQSIVQGNGYDAVEQKDGRVLDIEEEELGSGHAMEGLKREENEAPLTSAPSGIEVTFTEDHLNNDEHDDLGRSEIMSAISPHPLVESTNLVYDDASAAKNVPETKDDEAVQLIYDSVDSQPDNNVNSNAPAEIDTHITKTLFPAMTSNSHVTQLEEEKYEARNEFKEIQNGPLPPIPSSTENFYGTLVGAWPPNTAASGEPPLPRPVVANLENEYSRLAPLSTKETLKHPPSLSSVVVPLPSAAATSLQTTKQNEIYNLATAPSPASVALSTATVPPSLPSATENEEVLGFIGLQEQEVESLPPVPPVSSIVNGKRIMSNWESEYVSSIDVDAMNIENDRRDYGKAGDVILASYQKSTHFQNEHSSSDSTFLVAPRSFTFHSGKTSTAKKAFTNKPKVPQKVGTRRHAWDDDEQENEPFGFVEASAPHSFVSHASVAHSIPVGDAYVNAKITSRQLRGSIVASGSATKSGHLHSIEDVALQGFSASSSEIPPTSKGATESGRSLRVSDFLISTQNSEESSVEVQGNAARGSQISSASIQNASLISNGFRSSVSR